MTHPSDKSQTPEAIFRHDLYTYLRTLDKVDEPAGCPRHRRKMA